MLNIAPNQQPQTQVRFLFSTVAMVLAALLLTGCLKTNKGWVEQPNAWTKPDVTDEARRQDHRRCLAEAKRLTDDVYLTHRDTRDDHRATSGGGGLSQQLDQYEQSRERNHAYGDCMRQRGYIPAHEQKARSETKSGF